MDDRVKFKSARRKFRKRSKVSTLCWSRCNNVQFHQLAIVSVLWWLFVCCLMVAMQFPKKSPAQRAPTAEVSVPRIHTLSNFAVFPLPPPWLDCQRRSPAGSAALQTTATAVVSLYNIQYISQAVYYFQRVIKQLPLSLVNDVIVTADDEILATAKAKITDAVAVCDVCRLYFLGDSVYDTRTKVARFALNPVIVFIDARLLLVENVVEDLVDLVRLYPTALVSPQLSLFDAKHMVTNVGIYRSELTWALQAARAAVDPEEIEIDLSRSEKVINQTVVQREMFAVRKDFFREAADNTRFTPVTTDGHVLLSLRALQLGGNVLTSLCSKAYLGIHDRIHGSETPAFGPGLSDKNDFWFYTQGDFSSPTFQPDVRRKKQEEIFDFSHNQSEIMDPTTAIFQVVESPSLRSSSLLFYLLLSMSTRKRTSRDLPLFLDPLMSSLLQRQPKIFQRPKCNRFLGYMRSLNGMYALGVDKDSLAYPWLILTRNSSLWLGPLAFTGRYLSLKTSYVTRGPRSLYLSPLWPAKPTSQEFFFFQDQLVALNETQFVLACASLNARQVSVPVFMSASCPYGVSKFKFDVEFKTQDDCEARDQTSTSGVG